MPPTYRRPPLVPAPPGVDLRWGIRRTLVFAALVAGLLVVLLLQARPAMAQDGPSTTAPRRDLPGTELEAEERDDGTTSSAPWVIGSGLAAAAAIGIGGTILKRRAAAGDA